MEVKKIFSRNKIEKKCVKHIHKTAQALEVFTHIVEDLANSSDELLTVIVDSNTKVNYYLNLAEQAKNQISHNNSVMDKIKSIISNS